MLIKSTVLPLHYNRHENVPLERISTRTKADFDLMRRVGVKDTVRVRVKARVAF